MNLKKTLKSIKLHESTISMILGAIVIVVVGILVVNFFSKKGGETIPPVEVTEQKPLPTTHVVSPGEDLWEISTKYYGTGYNWVDIAQKNNIQDPNKIEAGQTLTIPDVKPRLALGQESPTTSPILSPEATKEVIPTTFEKEGQTVHKVAKGENLWKIAEKYYNSGYNWVDIAKENKLANANLIEEGQELVIPDVEARKPTVEVVSKETNPISGATYTVEKGDSLWKIAVRAYGDGYRWTDIAKENSLSNPNIIHAGNVLTLPR